MSQRFPHSCTSSHLHPTLSVLSSQPKHQQKSTWVDGFWRLPLYSAVRRGALIAPTASAITLLPYLSKANHSELSGEEIQSVTSYLLRFGRLCDMGRPRWLIPFDARSKIFRGNLSATSLWFHEKAGCSPPTVPISAAQSVFSLTSGCNGRQVKYVKREAFAMGLLLQAVSTVAPSGN